MFLEKSEVKRKEWLAELRSHAFIQILDQRPFAKKQSPQAEAKKP